MGKGFDRHLFGLRHIAKVKGFPEPDFYSDPTYLVRMAGWQLVVSASLLSCVACGESHRMCVVAYRVWQTSG